MINSKTTFGIVLMIGFLSAQTSAQYAIPGAGGNASGSGGTASYSIGQVFYDTYSDLEGSVAEGVQQPFEISIVTGIDEAGSIDLCYLAYPNPTNGFLMLKIENYSIEYLRYQLFDNSGKLIKSEEVTANPYTVTMEQLVTGTYFLKIIDKDKEIKIFKIIKN